MTTTTHTLIELRDLTDDNADGSFGAGMQARFARSALDCEQTGLSLQRLEPGARQAFSHRHEAVEEIYVVVAGAGTATVDGEAVALQPWSALRVAPAAVRTFAAGDDGLELLAFGTHAVDDGEILPSD